MLSNTDKLMLRILADLDPNKLYTATEAAATKISNSIERRRIGKKIWNLTNRDQLYSFPDNCLIKENGMPILDHADEKATIVLEPGQEYPRWLRSSWYSVLREKERRYILVYRLSILLSDYAVLKIDEDSQEQETPQPLPGPPEVELPDPQVKKKGFQTMRVLKWVAILLIPLIFLPRQEEKKPSYAEYAATQKVPLKGRIAKVETDPSEFGWKAQKLYQGPIGYLALLNEPVSPDHY